jgi:hypothetical protein
VDASARDLETLAAADLALSDRVDAEAKKPAASKSRIAAVSEQPARISPASIMASSKGYTFSKTALPDQESRVGLAPPLLEKPRALAKRMLKMCAQEPGSARSLSLADRTYVYPDLAKAVIGEHTDFTMRRRRYRDLNSVDRQRAFWRAIEDIADRSTGRLGPWWVK